MQVTNKVAGFYRLVARKADGSSRVVADWFPNLILNNGLNRLGSGAVITGAAIGRDPSPVYPTNTKLGQHVAWTTSLQTSTGSVNSTTQPYYGWQRYVYRFAQGSISGKFSEVGVGWGSTTLFSRALILDGNGEPTTITVLSDEYLDLYYELRLYPPEEDLVKTILMNGVQYTATIRAANIQNASVWRPALLNSEAMSFETTTPYGFTAYTGTIGTELTTPSGTADSDCISSIVQSAYVSGSYKRTCRFSMPYGQMTGGVRSIYFVLNNTGGLYCGGAYQIQFDPILPKPSTHEIQFTLEFSWARREV